jgi:hypothetical protein
VGICSLIAVAASALFAAYVAVRAIDVGVWDGVVMAVLGFSLLTAAIGAGMLLMAPRIHALASRLGTGSRSPSAVLVTVEELRKRRTSRSETVSRVCSECGNAYDAIAPDAPCPTCGRATRIA